MSIQTLGLVLAFGIVFGVVLAIVYRHFHPRIQTHPRIRTTNLQRTGKPFPVTKPPTQIVSAEWLM